jgi:hypothetical protein
MNSQTARQPQSRPNKSNKARKYTRQTARFEGKRDGKPILFGWGGHLSHKQKIQLQRRATWGAAIVFALLIVFVLVGFWININVITPGLPITSVNGHQIPQSLYRKMVALDAQLSQNQLNGPHGLIAQQNSLRTQVANQEKSVSTTQAQIVNLNKQIKALPAGASPQRTKLEKELATANAQLQTQSTRAQSLNQEYTALSQSVIPQAQTNYNQSQVGNDSVNWLQDDELIREWLVLQPASIQAKMNPDASQLSSAMQAFKANLPKNTSYSAVLNKDGVSDGDMQAMMTIKLRRDNMQSELAAREVSPQYQVLARAMTIDTAAHAQKVLNQLQHGGDFARLAKTNSSDSSTNTKGGSLGWLARGQYAQNYTAAGVENWMFDSKRSVDELSPVLPENGAFHIVQILGIDPARSVDAATLQTLKTNSLSNWILEQHALPSTKITPVDQNKLTDAANMPPNLPLSAPAGTPSAPGLPGQSLP